MACGPWPPDFASRGLPIRCRALYNSSRASRKLSCSKLVVHDTLPPLCPGLQIRGALSHVVCRCLPLPPVTQFSMFNDTGKRMQRETMGENGRQREITGDNWKTTGDNGRQREKTGDNGRERTPTGDNGRQRESMGGNVRQRGTTGDNGRQP